MRRFGGNFPKTSKIRGQETRVAQESIVMVQEAGSSNAEVHFVDYIAGAKVAAVVPVEEGTD